MFVINGVAWKVKRVPPDYPLLQTPKGNYAIGVCDRKSKLICINNQLRRGLIKEVLCHEITHAAMFSYNIQLTYDEEELIANLIAKYGHEIVSITDVIFKKLQRGYLL